MPRHHTGGNQQLSGQQDHVRHVYFLAAETARSVFLVLTETLAWPHIRDHRPLRLFHPMALFFSHLLQTLVYASVKQVTAGQRDSTVKFVVKSYGSRITPAPMCFLPDAAPASRGGVPRGAGSGVFVSA